MKSCTGNFGRRMVCRGPHGQKAVGRVLFILVFLAAALCSCVRETKPLENMTTLDTGEYLAIVWNDKTYVPFCGVSNEDRGAQIGFVNGDEKDRVYQYLDYPTEAWIISFYDSGEMDSSMLMREMDITDIPEGLHSEYAWNNE